MNFQMSLLFVLLFAGSFISGSLPAATFTDDFEAPTLDAFWTTTEINGSVGFTASPVHTGLQALELATTNVSANKDVQIMHEFGSLVYGAASVWVYDSAADESSGNYIEFYLYNQSLATRAGLYTQDYDLGASNGGHYYCDAFSNSGINTSVDRTKAWHLFEIVSQPNLLQFSIDGTTVHSAASGTPFNAVAFVVHAPGFRPGLAVQYDDFQITVPEPATIGSLAMGLAAALCVVPRGRTRIQR